ncbi:succinylglutamate desuccinylase [Alkalimarinus sediminis]|uniref:Succinylglutamate desuccinylase n=1 Tax=Alkalimarinus sediminis TaxID=1632866 RepID=A0A9E8HJZ1_9ALTE|nr:succinylglutamate desuccinylase [Alkalimarinus sediminis]UZW74073.1 succinylglutamate desuccinylase [Alkalimarinus sediminis]
MTDTNLSARQALFGTSTDFLAHTLEHATQSIESRSARLEDGTTVIMHELGVLEFVPVTSSNSIKPIKLILSAGIHGNETAPIEFCNQLINEAIDGLYSVKVPTLFIFGHPQAMVAGERFIEHNLNRLFCGTHASATYCDSIEGKRAALIEHHVKLFVKQGGEHLVNHYDLHTAIRSSVFERFAIYPYIAGRTTNPTQLQFLAFSDIEAFLFQTAPATTFSSHTAENYAAESFTVELGKVRPFGQNPDFKYRAITDNLRLRLKGRWPQPRRAEHRVQCFIATHEIINTGKDFVLHIPEDVSNFREYPKGSLIWEDNERSYRVKDQVEYIVFPNSKVGVGQRAGIMLRLVNMGEAPDQSTSPVVH